MPIPDWITRWLQRQDDVLDYGVEQETPSRAAEDAGPPPFTGCPWHLPVGKYACEGHQPSVRKPHAGTPDTAVD
jgi:hypothetical protein